MDLPDSEFSVERPSGVLAPWTFAGDRDPDYDEGARVIHRMLLTDPNLLTGFRRRFPARADASYDEMVRLLGYVWDCPHDATANVTGHCCASCRRSRAAALERRSRIGTAQPK